MDTADLLGEHRILSRSPSGLPGTPGVVATGGDSQHTAQPGDGIVSLLALYELERR
jgi:hypothetical protein